MKIRTDFVTNSSSSSFIVSLELITDKNKPIRSGGVYACADGSGGKGLAARAFYKGESEIIAEDSTVDSLCDMLFEDIVIENCCYDIDNPGIEYSFEDCEDKTFVVDGKLNYFEDREEITDYIENLGGRVVGSVSSKTDYLISNDKSPTSSKVKKAEELQIPIITEQEFIGLFGDPDDFDFDEDDVEPRDYSARELYPEMLEEIKKDCKENDISLKNIKSVVITEDICASFDDPVWDDILGMEYGGEKIIVTVYDPQKQEWQKVVMIGNDGAGNKGFFVLDQENARYVNLSADDLQVTETECKLFSMEDALRKWLEKLGVYEKKGPQVSTIHFQCDNEISDAAMSCFEGSFGREWKALVEKTKKDIPDCDEEYYPLTCKITDSGFDALIEPPMVPYIGEYYCDPGWGDGPLEIALKEFRAEFPDIHFEGHIEYVVNRVLLIGGEIETVGGTSAYYDLNSDSWEEDDE